MPQVKKAVITVAGLGTRFLPATKAVPKEMLPVLDKPVIQYIVEEMAASGIKEIIFVTHPTKSAIKNHFARDKKLEVTLKKSGKLDRIQSVIDIAKKVKFSYVNQLQPLGNGHALMQARRLCGNDTFAFSDGDSIIDARTPAMKQVIEVYNSVKAPVIGVQKIEDKQEMTKYGNVYGLRVTGYGLRNTYKVRNIIEKPPIGEVSPDGLIVGGMRYVFTKNFWKYLEKQKKGRMGEVWIADAADAMAKAEPFYAYEYEGTYFDTGDKMALLKTSNYFAQKV